MAGIDDVVNYFCPLGNGRKNTFFYGNQSSLGNGWITQNDSVLAIQTRDSIILTHNGNSSAAQVNIICKIQEIEKMVDKTIYISVEAKVHKHTEKGQGGVLGFINSESYDGGTFYLKTKVLNTNWEKYFLRILITEEMIKKGGSVCLRACMEENSCAVVEYKNVSVSEKRPDAYSEKENDNERPVAWDIIRDFKTEQKKRKEFMEGYEKLMLGFTVANRMVSSERNKHFIVVRSSHIGDIYADLNKMVWHKELNSKDGSIEIIIITAHLQLGIAKVFNSIDEVMIVDNNTELDALGYYARSEMKVHENLFPDSVTYKGLMSIGEFGHKYNLSHRCWIMNFPIKIKGAGDKVLSAQVLKEESINVAKEIIKTNKTDFHHTVIICPYAQSSSNIEEKYWENFIIWLKNNGYTVFTNVGRTEKELKGTIRLFVSIDVFMALGCLGVSIVGVQSGLMDMAKGMNQDIVLFFVHALFTNQDRLFCKARMKQFPVERRENEIHIAIESSEQKELAGILIKSFKYNYKGTIQKEQYDKECSPEWTQGINDLNTYMEYTRDLHDVIIFCAVYDSANKQWNQVNKAIWGINSDLGLSWRRSYVAVFDWENDFHYEKMGQNAGVQVYQGTFSDLYETEEQLELPADNYYYLCSHAMGANHYTKSAIVINGINYSLSERGLNIVVYSKSKRCVIDSVSVDLWVDKTLAIRRKERDKE